MVSFDSFRKILYSIGGRAVALFLQIATAIIISRQENLALLSGYYEILLFSTVVSAVFHFPLEIYYQKKFSLERPSETYHQRFVFSILGFDILLFCTFLILNYSEYLPDYYLLIAFFSFFFSLISFTRTRLNNIASVSVVVGSILVENIFRFLFVYIIFFFDCISWLSLSIFHLVSFAFGLWFNYFFLKHNGEKFSFKLKGIHKFRLLFLRDYCMVFQRQITLAISSSLGNLLLSFPKMFFVYTDRDTDLSIYSIISSFGHAGMGSLGVIFCQLELPKLYQSKGIYLRKYFFRASLCVLFGLACASAVGSEFVAFVNPELSEFWIFILVGALLESTNLVMGGIVVALSGNARYVAFVLPYLVSLTFAVLLMLLFNEIFNFTVLISITSLVCFISFYVSVVYWGFYGKNLYRS